MACCLYVTFFFYYYYYNLVHKKNVVLHPVMPQHNMVNAELRFFFFFFHFSFVDSYILPFVVDATLSHLVAYVFAWYSSSHFWLLV